MTIKGKRGTVSITIWQNDKEVVQRDVPATLYGPYWAVLNKHENNPQGASLTHTPTGLHLEPSNWHRRFYVADMRRAAIMLAEQGDCWNFGRETSKDGKSPEMRLAYDNWMLVCRALWPEWYPAP